MNKRSKPKPAPTSRAVIILEGPDGGGKSTLARLLVERLDARYVHLGVFPRVGSGLARLYVEAMLPALLGYQAVVLDRSWRSEPVYGAVMRGGVDRIGVVGARLLARLALRCDVISIRCLPPFEKCLEAYRSRRGVEYVGDERLLYQIWQRYGDLELPGHGFLFDYTARTTDEVLRSVAVIADDHELNLRHPAAWATAGALDAPTLLIGEAPSATRDADPLYQAPFVSFGRGGCASWLTDRLESGGIPEASLMWINADSPHLDEVLSRFTDRRVICLGEIVHQRVERLRSDAAVVEHPDRARRAGGRAPYELIQLLQGGQS